GETTRRQGLAIEPDTHGIDLLPADPHPRHAALDGEAIDQVTPGVIRELRHGHSVAGQVEPHDDVFVAVDLLDLGRIGLVRQVVEDARDAVAYIVCRRIDVAVDLELDGHDRTAILAHRLHETHAFDAGDAVLDHLRDATLDYARGSAPIIGFDRYHG